MDDSPSNGDDDELEEVEVQEGRVSFDRSSLDRYRASAPPSLTDDLRAVIQQFAERNTLRLCRRGKTIIRTMAARTALPVATSGLAHCALRNCSLSPSTTLSGCSSRCLRLSI